MIILRPLLILLLLALTPLPALATVTVRNFTTGGSPVVRFDTDGNAIDAHDGTMLQVGSTFYLYGTSYGCGFVWLQPTTQFCGFRAYSSTDLINWTDLGALFDATTSAWQGRCNQIYTGAVTGVPWGCFRPHVIYNAASNTYVLWINTGDPGATGYRVFTSSSPGGPFSEQTPPTMGSHSTNGDFGLFVDDNGTAYVVYRYWDAAFEGDIFVQALTSNYLNVTGSATGINATGINPETQSEAPSLFKNGSTYYVVYGLRCAFCSGTPTLYKTASSPLGPWSSATSISPNSCGGQPSFVTKLSINSAVVYLYGSDLWRGPGGTGFYNQGQANFFWIPLSFSGTAINPITCDVTFTASLTENPPASDPRVDQSSGQNLFQQFCGSGALDGVYQRVQTFVPAKTGTLTNIRFTTHQGPTSCDNSTCTPPNADLNVDLVTVDVTGKPSSVLRAATVPRSTIPWSPTAMTVAMNAAVNAESTYGIHVYTSATSGCYGFAYNDSNAYPAGNEYFSSNSGSTYSLESNRSLKFQDIVLLLPTYALTLATAGTGSGTTSGAGSYVAGATVTLDATAGKGASFAGWSPSPCAGTFVMPASALLCTATFTRGKGHK